MKRIEWEGGTWRVCCGGPKTQPSQQISQQQQDIMTKQNRLQQENYRRMLELEQPAISKYTALASGDPTKVFQAAAPFLTPITQQTAAAKEQIYEQVPPGAGRDVALAETIRGGRTATAQALAGPVAGAPDVLANIGQGFGAFSLQELGAGLRAGEGAAATQSNIMQAQAQQKQATMGFLGSLAGAAGAAAGGGAFGALGGGAKKLPALAGV